MSYLMTEQLEHETSTWKRLLNFLIDENIRLKNRLSEIVRNITDRPSLGKIEEFQNRFIKADEYMRILRDDIASLDKLSEENNKEEGRNYNKLEVELNELRKNMIMSEIHSGKLKIEFNDFFLRYLNANTAEGISLRN